jgi:hypothetical protein
VATVSERRQRVKQTRTGPGLSARGLRGRPPARLPRWSRPTRCRSRPVQGSRSLVSGLHGHGNGHVVGHGFHGASRAMRPTARQRVAHQASVATPAAQSNRDCCRASERFVRERPQRVEQTRKRPGPSARGLRWRPSAAAVTAARSRCRSRPAQGPCTAPDHCGQADGHGFHGTSHSDHGDGERPVGPDFATASVAGAQAFIHRPSRVSLRTASASDRLASDCRRPAPWRPGSLPANPPCCHSEPRRSGCRWATGPGFRHRPRSGLGIA